MIASVLAALRSHLPTFVLTGLILYFGFHALTGERGILEEDHRRATLAARQMQLAQLQARRSDLERRAELLRDDNLSADLLEERARDLLGYADARDYVVRVNR